MGKGCRFGLVFLILMLLIQTGGEAKASPPVPLAGLQVSRQGDTLTLDWVVPPVQVVEGDDRTSEILISGYSIDERAGAPRLPFSAALVALNGAELPAFTILQADESFVALPAPVKTAAAAGEMLYAPGNVPLGRAILPGGSSSQAAVVDANPPALVEVTYAGETRGVHLARVVLHPALPAGGGKLQVFSRVRVALKLGLPPEKSAASGDIMLVQIQKSVVNPEYAVSTPATLSLPGMSRQAAIQRTDPIRAVVEINQAPNSAPANNAAGMYRVTYAQLVAADARFNGVNPANLRMAHNGTEIAYEFEGDADALFETGEALVFYAASFMNRYSNRDAYQVWYDVSTPGLRMSTDAAAPGTTSSLVTSEIFFDNNEAYLPEPNFDKVTTPGRDGDMWAWKQLIYLGWGDTFSTSFVLPAFNSGQNVDFSLWVRGASAASHAVRVRLNGCTYDTSWSQYSLTRLVLSGVQGCLAVGNNTFYIEALDPGTGYDVVFLDSISLRFIPGTSALSPDLVFTGASAVGSFSYSVNFSSAQDRVYRITNPAAPVRLNRPSGTNLSLGDTGSGQKYLATAASLLRTPASVRADSPLRTNAVSGANYLIIAPAGWHNFITPSASPLAPLIELRQLQGMTVVVEELQSIYDQYRGGTLNFSGAEYGLWGGYAEADAVRNYLLQVYNTWNPRPTFVLLVGDGSADPKQYRPESFATYFPPYLANISDPLIKLETASDNIFVNVAAYNPTPPKDVAKYDLLPDYLVGRLPVNSTTELAAVVNKITNYELGAEASSAWWHNLVGLISDRAEYDYFRLVLERATSTHVFKPRLGINMNYPNYGDPPSSDPPGFADAFRLGVQQMWNRGTALVVYAGHGAYHFWSDREILRASDVPALTNGQKLPVVVEMTCFTGSFHYRTISSLDETLVRAPNGGAVAVWGPSGSGLSYGHIELTDGFLRTVLSAGDQTLGSAAYQGKLELVQIRPENIDLVSTFHLFGDPATIFNKQTVESQSMYLPELRR